MIKLNSVEKKIKEQFLHGGQIDIVANMKLTSPRQLNKYTWCLKKQKRKLSSIKEYD